MFEYTGNPLSEPCLEDNYTGPRKLDAVRKKHIFLMRWCLLGPVYY